MTLLTRLLVLLGFLFAVAVAGCDSEPSPEAVCARSCAGNGYEYAAGYSTAFSSRPARCICGSATDGGLR